jgi:hypothetical protein
MVLKLGQMEVKPTRFCLHIHLHGICRTTFRNFNNQWFYTSDSEMITFILGLLIGYFGKEHITALLIKAKDKISEYFSK